MSQYFENDENIKSKIRKINCEFSHYKIIFDSDNGVFSKNEIDYGTRALIDAFLHENKKGNILDMGGGIGVISIVLSKILNCHSTMSEINKRAVELAEFNAKYNGVENLVKVVESDGYKNIEGKYDFVITNPPIRAGKKVVYDFLLNSIDFLNEGGELWFVMRKNHGQESARRDVIKVFGNCEIITRDKGFYIMRATKK